MKTYVINLRTEVERREHIINLLKQYSFLDVEFIDAFDARNAGLNDLKSVFDINKCNQRRGKTITKPEIGCTLSHCMCYRRFLDSNEEYCLILEDDIDVPVEDFEEIIRLIVNHCKSEIPIIILLSDWFWFSKKGNFVTKNYRYVKIFNAYLTHAYIINRKAAELLIKDKPNYVADEWLYIRKKGIQIFAILPHLVQQKWDGEFKTSIQNQYRNKASQQLLKLVRFLPYRIFQFYLKMTGRFYGPHKV